MLSWAFIYNNPGKETSMPRTYHIHHGDIGISPSQLPYKPSTHHKKHAKPHRSLKRPGNLSIEERPDLDDRSEFGHWEMDTVVSGLHGNGGLLVLIERQPPCPPLVPQGHRLLEGLLATHRGPGRRHQLHPPSTSQWPHRP